MNRTPPIAVRRQLRKEVGFGCPLPDCGIPYLTWHHFDPEWRVEEHHRPEGMIALCLTHAGFADGGAYEKDYLRGLKLAGRPQSTAVRGHLEWMRRDVLALVGGNWYYEVPIILQIGSRKAIWFGRDDDGFLLLNVVLPTLSGSPRAEIEENYFTIGRDHVADITCAARGRSIRIEYPNGDLFRLEFREVVDRDELGKRFSPLVGDDIPSGVHFPVTVVEVTEETQTYQQYFDPRLGSVANSAFTGAWFIGGQIGVLVAVSPDQETLLFPDNEASSDKA